MQSQKQSRGNLRIIGAVGSFLLLVVGAVIATQLMGEPATKEPVGQTIAVNEETKETSEKEAALDALGKIDAWINGLAVKATEDAIGEIFADNAGAPPSVPKLKDVTAKVVSKDKWLADNQAEPEEMRVDWPGVDIEKDPIAYTEAEITIIYYVAGEQVEDTYIDFDALLIADEMEWFIGLPPEDKKTFEELRTSANSSGLTTAELAKIARIIDEPWLKQAIRDHRSTWDPQRVLGVLLEQNNRLILSALQAINFDLL